MQLCLLQREQRPNSFAECQSWGPSWCGETSCEERCQSGATGS